MKRRKCQIIPVSVYDGGPAILFEDNTHKYHKGAKGHYLKITRKTCSECASTAVYVGIFRYKTHNRVERFCRVHAAAVSKGPLPIIPEIETKPRKSVII